MNKPQKMSFEVMYEDDSGVKFAVQMDTEEEGIFCGEEGKGVIEITCIDKISLPLKRLDWLMGCLKKIRAELPDES